VAAAGKQRLGSVVGQVAQPVQQLVEQESEEVGQMVLAVQNHNAALEFLQGSCLPCCQLSIHNNSLAHQMRFHWLG
jgi:hypothetical protein